MKKAKKTQLFLFLLVIVLGISLSFSNKPLATQSATYVGPDECQICHAGLTPDIYPAWNASLHPKMIRNLTTALLAEYGLNSTDLEAHGIYLNASFPFTIGGNWKLRFINATADPNDPSKWTVAVWQYVIATGEWQTYHAPPDAPKDWGSSCAQCHVTGFDSATETFWGTIADLTTSVSCESCHGPGSEHATDPYTYPMIIDVSAQVCGQCHIRPASGTWPVYEIGNASSFSYTHGEGLHKHHQQFYDWNMSVHSLSMETTLPMDSCLVCHSADLIFNTDLITLLDLKYTLQNATNPVTCASCHSAHTLDLRISHNARPMYGTAGDVATGYTVCAQCHSTGERVEEVVKEHWYTTTAEFFNGSVHYASGVTCVSCHMALDAKSAVAYDLRNHTMIVESYGTYEYSCGQAVGCHKEQLETWPEWAEQRIEEIHTTVNATLQKAEEAITQAEAAITTANQTTGVNQTAIEEAESLLLQAKSYSSFVEADGSLGFHNPTYALSLLSTAIDYTLQAESTALEARATALASDVTTLGAQVTSLQNQITTLQSDIESLEARIDDLESTAATVPYLYGGIGLAIGFIIGAAIVFVVRRGKP